MNYQELWRVGIVYKQNYSFSKLSLKTSLPIIVVRDRQHIQLTYTFSIDRHQTIIPPSSSPSTLHSDRFLGWDTHCAGIVRVRIADFLNADTVADAITDGSRKPVDLTNLST
jgi:hypothetical protein